MTQSRYHQRATAAHSGGDPDVEAPETSEGKKNVEGAHTAANTDGGPAPMEGVVEQATGTAADGEQNADGEESSSSSSDSGSGSEDESEVEALKEKKTPINAVRVHGQEPLPSLQIPDPSGRLSYYSKVDPTGDINEVFREEHLVMNERAQRISTQATRTPVAPVRGGVIDMITENGHVHGTAAASSRDKIDKAILHPFGSAERTRRAIREDTIYDMQQQKMEQSIEAPAKVDTEGFDDESNYEVDQLVKGINQANRKDVVKMLVQVFIPRKESHAFWGRDHMEFLVLMYLLQAVAAGVRGPAILICLLYFVVSCSWTWTS